MGDMADYEIGRIEDNDSYIKDKSTGKIVKVSNMLLMYSSIYDNESRYELLDENDIL